MPPGAHQPDLGATGRDGIYRDQQPGYFWTLFAVRLLLGPLALIGGLRGLAHLQAGAESGRSDGS